MFLRNVGQRLKGFFSAASSCNPITQAKRWVNYCAWFQTKHHQTETCIWMAVCACIFFFYCTDSSFVCSMFAFLLPCSSIRRFFFNKPKKNLYINRKTAWSRTEFLCYEILFSPNIAFRDKNASRFFLSQLWICIPLWFHMNCFANLNFLNRSTFFSLDLIWFYNYFLSFWFFQ